MLVGRRARRVMVTDAIPYRRRLAAELGAEAFDPHSDEIDDGIRKVTEGRGADAVVLATNVKGLVEQALRISRPGAKILLFAQTSATERIELSGADICVGERKLLGSYSADVDLQAESARLVFGGELPLERLISHRLPLDSIIEAIDIALHPDERSLKVVIRPQESR
jgi:L-iditol 2-dehydrogenase